MIVGVLASLKLFGAGIAIVSVLVMLIAIFSWHFFADKVKLDSGIKDRNGRCIKEGHHLLVILTPAESIEIYRGRVFLDSFDNMTFKVTLYGRNESEKDKVVTLDSLRSDSIEIGR
jgi:hypothetical protein